MAKATYISAGSSTLVKSGPGVLFGLYLTPANGATVYAVDALNIGAIPNLNTDLTGTISRVTYGAATPDSVDFQGIHFDNGLVVAATSSARITVFTD